MTRIFKDLLKDDIIAELLDWPSHLIHYKWSKIIAIFSFGCLVFETLICTIFYFTTLESELRGKYSIFGLRATIAICSYITLFSKQHEYHEILWEIFPKFWSLRCAGQKTFDKLEKLAKIFKIISSVTILLTIVGGMFFLPYGGNGYDVYLPVKLYTDYVHKGKSLFVTIFNVSFVYMGLIIISSALVLSYLIIHLSFQCLLLSEKIKHIARYLQVWDGQLINHDKEHQNYIYDELVYCVKHHQLLIHFGERINTLIYFPIFGFTVCGIVVGVCLIYFLKSASEHFIICAIIGFITMTVVVAFGAMGQILEDESENISKSMFNIPWYSLDMKNRKVLLVFILGAQKYIVLTSSGLVTLNYKLFILLYRCIYSALTLSMNIGI